MPSPEHTGVLINPENISYKATLTYQSGTSFLSPTGEGMLRYSEVPEPTLEAALSVPHKELPRHSEIAFISFSAALHWDAQLFGRDHSAIGKPSIPIGETYVATNWQHIQTETTTQTNEVVRFGTVPMENTGVYEFTSLNDLVDAPELPLYTAEWLARMLKRSSVQHTLGLLELIIHKPPLPLIRESRMSESGQPVPYFENHTERWHRIAKALLQARPDLLSRFMYRGVPFATENKTNL